MNVTAALRTIGSTLLLASLAASSAGCTHTEAAASEDRAADLAGPTTRVTATTSVAHHRLSTLRSVHDVSNAEGLTLRVYEHHSDGMMNGMDLWLGAFDASGAGYVFELTAGLMRDLTSVEHVSPNAVRIVATRDEMIDGELTRGLPYELTVRYTTEGGVLAWEVEADDSDGRSYRWLATTKPEEAMFANILRAASAANDGVSAAVFETIHVEPPVNGSLPSLKIGARPARNGAHVLLSLDTGLHAGRFTRETYDLALDVTRVEKVELVAADRLSIEGSTMNEIGELRPFAYSVRFTLDADGAPAKTIELAMQVDER